MTLQNSWLVCSRNTWASNVESWNVVSLFTSQIETRVVSHVDDPLICAKLATLEKFWAQITRLVVIKRGEALNPHILVTYLGFE